MSDALDVERTEGMRAITLHRPWSFAVAHLGKDVENRGWRTNYRGLLAIHGGAKWSNDAASGIARINGRVFRADEKLTSGAGIVAVANLVGCHDADDTANSCCEHSPWAQCGVWHWVLADVRTLPKPVPCKGRQGLWRLPKDVERAVWNALAGER